MTSVYDEIEIEDFEYEGGCENSDANASGTYYYPCPCGDRFQITLEELRDGEELARCPSCSLMVRIIYDPSDLSKRASVVVEKSVLLA